jgi:hypothetical protein
MSSEMAGRTGARAAGWARGATAGAGWAVEEEQEQREAGGRSNGRGHTRGLLDQLVHRPRRAASECDGCPRPIISGVL